MIWDWIMGSIPPWVWLAAGVAAVLVIAAVLRQGGWKWALAASAAALAAYFQAKSYHRGAASERAKQDAADQHARDVIAETKEDVRTIAPAERKERFERWQKRS